MVVDSQSLIYLTLQQGLLRWLHGIDFNPTSETYGVADREYWAWKLKDFANGTHQAGLSAFLDGYEFYGLSESVDRESVIKAILAGTKKIQRSNGSFEEAYPLESSYAVTGLVQFNLLYCYFKYPNFFTGTLKNEVFEITKKSQNFLKKTKETHGLIANHRASSELAMALFELFENEESKITFPFLKEQNLEGWFPEYNGADPGYQTLLNHYMSAFLSCTKNKKSWPKLEESLQKSLSFVSHFMCPDGHYSGEIGGRGTSIVYPSGLLDADGSAQTWFLQKYINKAAAITPLRVDVNNFVPVLNSWALYFADGYQAKTADLEDLYMEFPEAGLQVYRSREKYLLINLINGTFRSGVFENEEWQDRSIVSFNKGREATQLGESKVIENSPDLLHLELRSGHFGQSFNTPLRSIVIRKIAILIYLFPLLQSLFKQALAKFVIKSSKETKHTGIELKINKKSFDIEVVGQQQWKALKSGFFTHMASANTFKQQKVENDL